MYNCFESFSYIGPQIAYIYRRQTCRFINKEKKVFVKTNFTKLGNILCKTCSFALNLLKINTKVKHVHAAMMHKLTFSVFRLIVNSMWVIYYLNYLLT